MSDKFIKYQDWIWRGSVILLLLGQYWARENFVTKSEYSADKTRWENIVVRLDQNLNSINLTLEAWKFHTKMDSDQDAQLKDHEDRIRELEVCAATYHGKTDTKK